jgi:hypothetical protein
MMIRGEKENLKRKKRKQIITTDCKENHSILINKLDVIYSSFDFSKASPYSFTRVLSTG